MASYIYPFTTHSNTQPSQGAHAAISVRPRPVFTALVHACQGLFEPRIARVLKKAAQSHAVEVALSGVSESGSSSTCTSSSLTAVQPVPEAQEETRTVSKEVTAQASGKSASDGCTWETDYQLMALRQLYRSNAIECGYACTRPCCSRTLGVDDSYEVHVVRLAGVCVCMCVFFSLLEEATPASPFNVKSITV